MEMLGRYRITGRIGAGSFATVYRGEDDSLDISVAIKVLADNWSTNDDVRARFVAEARLLRRLGDERIVRVYDIGTTPQGQPYFVMDLADGGSLEGLRKQPVAPGLALRLCAEASRALDVLHRNQLVHRDVTPGNILLSSGPSGVRVMLADLGVAKSLLDEQRDTMTAGTPAYMAPEQARSTQLDQRSDIYSMACVGYALLTGRPPFPARTLTQLVERNPSLGPAPIAHLVDAPQLLDEVFASSLAWDPNRRPQTALQLAAALDRLADVMVGGDQYQSQHRAASPQGPVPITPSAPAPSIIHTSGGRHDGSTGPDSQTPTGMLDNYIGKGRYRPALTREKHAPWLWLWVGMSAVALLGLTMWATVHFLTR
ncbi:serine/threonine-protein kinase [Tessaracoccus sp.]